MIDQRRLIKYYLVLFVAVVLLFTIAYDIGMSVLEGRPRGPIHSLEVVMQTFTTTGYGQDAPWQSVEMTVLVVLMQLSSTVLLFAALPVVVVPLMEEMLTLTAPTETAGETDHVIVCGHGSDSASLIDELETRGVEYVLLVEDRDVANDLYETGINVVHADPESPGTLGRVDARQAKAIVADLSDQANLSIVMAATEVAPDIPTYSIAEDPEFVEYHRHAGADAVFSPRALLGKGLANKVRATVSTNLSGTVELGRDFEIGEFPITPESGLRNQTVAEADVDGRTGVTVIGAWSNGQFRRPPFPELRLDKHTVLLVAGRADQLDRLARLTGSTVRPYERGEVVLAGSGIVGSTVREALDGSNVSVTTIDLKDSSEADVIGDVTDRETLDRAGVTDAQTVVLALDDDTTTLIATFVVRDLAPDVEVIVRADQRENVGKFYRAGADYVLALDTVSGRLLASAILEQEEPVSVDRQVQVVRRRSKSFAGSTLEEISLPERTGCTVVAVEHRDGRVSVNPGKWTELRRRDQLIITGLKEDIDRFDELLDERTDS